MRGLYLPQLGMRSYADGRWLVGSDGHLVIMGAIVHELGDGFEWRWMLPKPEQMDDAWGEALYPGVGVRHTEWMPNALTSRFFLNVPDLVKEIEEYPPDFAIVEAPEHVKTFRCAQFITGHTFPIITQFNHVNTLPETKVPDQYNTMLRQIEGMMDAEATTFPLIAAARSWLEAATDLVNYPELGKYIDIWPALFTPSEADGYKTDVDGLEAVGYASQNDVTIFYAGRLADAPRTKFDRFFKCFDKVRERYLREGVDVKCWVANPNEAMSWERVMQLSEGVQAHPYGNRTLTRDEYFYLLWAADIVPVLYPTTHICSVGYCEAAITENVIVTEFRGAETAGITYESPASDGAIEEALAKAISLIVCGGKEAHCEKQREWVLDHYSIERNVDKIRKTIDRVTK